MRGNNTLEAFIAWLDALPEDHRFDRAGRGGIVYDCPIAQFTGACVTLVGVAGWQRTFINIFDGRSPDHLARLVVHSTLSDARSIAAMIRRQEVGSGG